MIASLPREILKWIHSLDLSYSVKNVRRDFNNGFLIAEILSRYYPLEVEMHTFEYGASGKYKKDNWNQIRTFFKKKGIQIDVSNIDALMQNTDNITLEVVKSVFTHLTERPVLEAPKLGSREITPTQQSYLLKDKELTKMNQNELDFFKTDEMEKEKSKTIVKEEEIKKEHSILISKGPQRPIPQELASENFPQMEVVEPKISTVTKNLLNLRAEKEGHMVNMGGKSTSQTGRAYTPLGRASARGISSGGGINQQSRSSYHRDDLSSQHMSRVLSHDTMVHKKPLSEILYEIISNKLSNEFNNEMQILQIDNDLLNSFFFKINLLSAPLVISVFQQIHKRKEEIIDICLQNLSDAAFLYTVTFMTLRNLKANNECYEYIVEFICSVGRELTSEPIDDPCRKEFLKYFTSHALKKIAEILLSTPSKGAFLARVIFSHAHKDPAERINIIRILKDYLDEDLNTMIFIFAKLIELESEYQEVIFDVYLYYAINGIQANSPFTRSSALRILIIISKYNHEPVLNIVDKLEHLISDQYWEVKVQLIILACELLSKLEGFKDVLKSEEVPAAKVGKKEKQQLERNILKAKLQMLFNIIQNGLTPQNSLSVIKIGLIHLLSLLEVYKQFYQKLIEMLLVLPQDILLLFIEPSEPETTETTYYTYGSFTFPYLVRPDTRNIDKIALMKALCDYIHTNNLEHLDEEHMKVLLACITKPVLTSELESWLKIFKNIKDYLFVALLDPELVLSALTILNKFFTINNITETVFDESEEILVKTLALLYEREGADESKQHLLEYIKSIDESSHRVLKEFFIYRVIKIFKEEYNELFLKSNLQDLVVT